MAALNESAKSRLGVTPRGFKLTKVNYANTAGLRELEDGFLHPCGLAICGERGSGNEKGVWRITHAKSGQLVIAFERKKDAVKCVRRLKHLDWKISDKDLRESLSYVDHRQALEVISREKFLNRGRL